MHWCRAQEGTWWEDGVGVDQEVTLPPVMENEDPGHPGSLGYPGSLFQAEFTWPEVYASLADISYLSLRL